MSTLRDEIVELERQIARLGTEPVALQALEARVTRFCETASSREPADARALAADLERLIAALDAASERLRSASPVSDSAPASGTAGTAAAAYGAALKRRQRGF